MDERQIQLSNLKAYIKNIDKDLINILNSLQWDRTKLLESKESMVCRYDPHHRILLNKALVHGEKCYLKSNGYNENDILLPDPPDHNCMTLIKLGKEDLALIINAASNGDPMFKRGSGGQGPEPKTLERLQSTYTADERRVIHDAVVAAVPAYHNLSDLALLSSNGVEGNIPTSKSRMEILAELRNMKRRRTKYRIAAKSQKYSDVLRDVIQTQMEVYKDMQDEHTSDKNMLNKNDEINIASKSNNGDRFAEVSHVQLNESEHLNKHRHESKDRFREDSRIRFNYTDSCREDEKSKHTFRETANDDSNSHCKYGKDNNNSAVKYGSAKEKFKKGCSAKRVFEVEKRRRTPDISRSERIKECRNSVGEDKRHGSASRMKYKDNSDEKYFTKYHRERNTYSDLVRKDNEGGRRRRYYDTLDKKEFNNEKRKRRK